MSETEQARWERINAMDWDTLIRAVQAKARWVEAERAKAQEEGRMNAHCPSE